MFYSYLAQNQSVVPPPVSEVKLQDLSSVYVSSQNSVLFADLSAYSGSNSEESTKSIVQNDVSLESLIDRGRIEELLFEDGLRLTQIPFKSNCRSEFAYVGADVGKMVSNDSLSIVKKFIVLAEEPGGEVDTYVATMVSRPEYLEIMDDSDISYLCLGNFTGLIIESQLDGTLRSVTYSKNGRVFDTEIFAKGQVLTDDYTTMALGLPIQTKDIAKEVIPLSEVECIAYRDRYESPLGGGGSQEEHRDDSEKGYEDEEEDQQDEGCESGGGKFCCYTIDLSVNNPKLGEVNFWCIGMFYKGTQLPVQVKVNNGAYFSRWQGHFKGMSASFWYEVKEDVTDMAILYDSTVPCWNSTKNVMNPILGGTSILPSGRDGWNKKGGLYGPNRYYDDGRKKNHQGIDISAAVGTPIYAMADGVILDDVSKYNRRYVTEQVNRIGVKKYPAGYEGDDGAYGNIIYYDCVINNEEVTVALAHLQEVTPVAINPRTNMPFKPGDEIYQGEVIAYTGITGNANQGYGPHLHLGVQKNGEWVDPAPYINGKISKVDIYKILNVQCDERDNQGIFYEQ